MSVLYKDMEVGQSVIIDGSTVTIEGKTGRRIRLKIEAEPSVVIKQGHNARTNPKLKRADLEEAHG